jgi:hypothetical protein
MWKQHIVGRHIANTPLDTESADTMSNYNRRSSYYGGRFEFGMFPRLNNFRNSLVQVGVLVSDTFSSLHGAIKRVTKVL